MTVKLHVVCPGRNTSAFAADFFKSVLPQLNADDWLIWVDDNSDDRSEAVAASIVDHQSNVDLFRNDCRRGSLSNTIDFALSADEDAVIVQFDADDILVEGSLDRIRHAFSDDNIWALHGGFDTFSGSTQLPYMAPLPWPDPPKPMRDGTFRLSGLRAWRSALTKKVREEDLLVGGHRPFYGGDNLLLPLFEMAGQDRICQIQAPLIRYRLHPKNNYVIESAAQKFTHFSAACKPRYLRLENMTDEATTTPNIPPIALLLHPDGTGGYVPVGVFQ